ncbi:hypothetical protein E9531_14015 [Lampropedia puyangensis]|uniref:Uncharacterized protein n=1 Tax=Lampropedia puyangensis TaxID=1330072 RepID=A0A4V4GR09_9BURK|nr:hypothetical protein [Lampropedia puyangensis]THT98685.1 hypothetical protein E9531_14015 [Lampropedia puyangensis]
MKQANCIELKGRSQQGDALIEALVALLLASVIGLGLTYSLGRMTNAQRTMNAQNMAVQTMRESLVEKGFSTSEVCRKADGSEETGLVSSSPFNNSDISFALECESTTVTVNGEAISMDAIKSIRTGESDSNADLYGGDGDLVISTQ